MAILRLPKSTLWPQIIYVPSTSKIHSLFSKDSPPKLHHITALTVKDLFIEVRSGCGWVSLDVNHWVQLLVYRFFLIWRPVNYRNKLFIPTHSQHTVVRKAQYCHSRYFYPKRRDVEGPWQSLLIAVLKSSHVRVISDSSWDRECVEWMFVSFQIRMLKPYPPLCDNIGKWGLWEMIRSWRSVSL